MQRRKRDFLNYYKEVKNVLSPNFKNLFEKVALTSLLKGTIIKIEGEAPEFKVIRNTKGENFEETVRARHLSSVSRQTS